ncbi:glycosyltransferase family 2 protein [Effusibacillus dendaii]|uniref:Glycosyltransferase 2-like domain-containing protein n=1 Tax=Effusibacillus dendaii TaxID=2743772 RepID=A0A7I8DCP7_9BACL|nr:glycosyltransferase family 2 protein [Effusibacillus dendaii]BCJ87797.1 hypothetical protein skT53_27820 [Effusibacillus dendaii]
MSKVSVHIVTYNSARDIETCLASVFKQTCPIDQIIVIDNDSHDGTSEILQAYNNKIKFVQNNTNLGFAAAHNQAIRISNSDYCLILNPDVVLNPGYVERLLDHAKQDPEIGAATGKLLLASAVDQIDSTGILITKSRRAFDRGVNQPADRWNSVQEVFGVSGAAALYRREMIEDISLNCQFFDESFFAYKEDVDVAWRGQLLGWKAVYVPDAVAYHERGWKTGKRSKQSVRIRQHSYINRYQMMLKNESLFFFLLHLPFILPYELAAFLYMMVREPNVLSAWKILFRNLPHLIKWRKWIKQKRTVPYHEVYRFF